MIQSDSMDLGACPHCGTPISRSDDDGLCAGCLLGLGLDVDPAVEESSEDGTNLLSSLAIGPHFGGYEIVREIGRGAMGVVLLGKQSRPKRYVALKVIASGELATPKMVARFKAEAQAAAKLDHPHIVPVYEVAEEGGWHYYSMRWIQGGTLADRIKTSLPEPKDAVGMMICIAEAVHHAHQRGVLHRDIKPTNILIDDDGKPHLSDFGLAKILEEDHELTRSVAVMGTPAYMSPEQVDGGAGTVTTKSDVYGLGAVFYEMLTGRPPFTADSTVSLFQSILRDDPPSPAMVRSEGSTHLGAGFQGVDRDLNVICLKCLEKNQAHRYASADALADDLRRWLADEPIQARPATWPERTLKWCRRRPALASLALTASAGLLALIVLWAQFSFRLQQERNAAQQNAVEAKNLLISSFLVKASRHALAREGTQSLLALNQALKASEEGIGDKKSILERLQFEYLNSPRLIRYWAVDGIPSRLQFSRDDEVMAAVMEHGGVRVWNLPASEEYSLPMSEGKPPYYGVLIGGGKRLGLVYERRPFLEIYDLETGGRISVKADEFPGKVIDAHPDGSIMAVGGTRIQFFRAGDGERMPIEFEHSRPCHWLGFSPDGRWLLSVHEEDRAWLWNVLTGERHPSFDAVATLKTTDLPVSPPRFSPDGSMIMLMKGYETEVYDVESGERLHGMPHSGPVFDLDISPDGRFYSTAAWRSQTRSWSLGDGHEMLGIIGHESGSHNVRFSPDSSMMASAGFDYELRICTPDTRRLLMPILYQGALIRSLEFSHSGRFLAVSCVNGALRVFDLMARNRMEVPWGVFHRKAAFIPGGKHLIANDGVDSLRVLDLEAGVESIPPLTAEGNPDPFAVDNHGEFAAGATSGGTVTVWNLKTRTPVSNMELGEVCADLFFSPDGRYLAVALQSGRCVIYEAETGDRVGDGFRHAEPIVEAGEWSSDQRWIALRGGSHVTVWDGKGGGRLLPPIALQDRASAVHFSPDSISLAVAFNNTSVSTASARLFRLPTLKPMLRPLEHDDGVQETRFSPDGKLLATAGEDNVVKIWDLADGSMKTTPLRHSGIVHTMDFRPDSKVLATGCYDGFLRLWNIERGELMGSPLYMGMSRMQVRFSADGVYLTAGNNSSGGVILEFNEPALPEPVWEKLAQFNSGYEVSESGGDLPIPPRKMSNLFNQLLSQYPNLFKWPVQR